MYTIESSVLQETGYTANQLDVAAAAVRSNNKFDDFQAFVDAEDKYGISSLYLLAHAAVESAWATEQIAPNNIFGFNADDSNPVEDASHFSSQAACIDFVANFLKKNYLTEGGVYYNGPTLHDIFEEYSSSHDTEAETVAEVMNLLQEHLPNNSVVVPSAPPVPTYKVQSGDTLTALTRKYPGTTIQGWVDANKNKYFNMTADFIETGWDLIIPGTSSPEVTHTVVSGDTLSGLAYTYHTSIQQIVDWNKDKYPLIGTGPEALIVVGWNLKVQ